MSLTKLTFSKDWRNALDFPTHEMQESKVREDMQLLHNETKNAFNNFLTNELVAENVGFNSSSAGVQGDNVQGAIDYVYSQIQEQETKSIVDGSVTTAKLGDGAVTNAKIANSTITGTKIANNTIDGTKLKTGAVSASVLADGSVTANLMATDSVDTGNIINYKVTAVKLANDSVQTRAIVNSAVTTAKLADGSVTTDKIADSAVTDAKIAGMATSKLSGTISNAQLAGSIAASKLAGSIPFSKFSASAVTTAATAIGTTATSVACAGVTSSSNIIVTPEPSYFIAWRNNGVRCTGQGTNTITLIADTATTVKANVLIFN